jgi:hypothetical protein
MMTEIPSGSDAGGDEDRGCGCGDGEDGLGRDSDGSSGGEGNRGERDSNKLVSGLYSLRSFSSHFFLLAFLISGGAVGDGVWAGDKGAVG